MKKPQEGGVVDAIPAPTRPFKYNDINWDHQANLARLTGKPVLAAENLTHSRIKAVMQYDREPFRDTTGHIKVSMRNSTVNPEDGVRYGDVYFEWIPNTPSTTTPTEGK